MDFNKNYFIVGFVCLSIGASLSFLKKPEVREVVKYEIKEVTKEVVKKDTITKIKETKNKDGSTIIETEIVDKSKIENETDKNVHFDSQKSIKNIANKHLIQLSQSLDSKLATETIISYTFRALPPLFVGAEITNKMDYKAKIGLELEF